MRQTEGEDNMCKACETKSYVGLHNHTDFSVLDGYAKVDEYIEAAKEMGMIGIGLADHGTASGLFELITKSKKAGLIPVPGVEFYVAPENPLGARVRTPIFYGPGGKKAPKYDVGGNGLHLHLTVFAYNNVGLSNLFKLTSKSWEKENFYSKPRIDTNMLAEHAEGLIATTGCPSSEISTRFLLGQDKKAYEYATRMKSIFGDNYYVELMNHDMEEDLERIILPKLIKLARDLDIKVIATNDSHYANKKDAGPHERQLAIQTGSKMSEPGFNDGGTRFSFSGPEYYLKSYDEMYRTLPADIAEEALANTLELTHKCEGINLEYNPHLRPSIEVPEGKTTVTHLRDLILEGYKTKRANDSEEVKLESQKRIQEEFKVIHSNDFVDYFLVVHDYINWAHTNGISIGAGRGSVGGSEIAYLLDISNTDPIRFDLLFERFLSPGRGSLYQIDYIDGTSEEIAVSENKVIFNAEGNKKAYVHEIEPGDTINHGNKKKTVASIFVKVPGSAPDIDTDFHTGRRQEVIDYIINKYGHDNVANIITFDTFKAKSSFKSMCTIYEIPYATANAVTKLIPDPAEGEDMTLEDLFNPMSPRYAEGEDFRSAVEDPQWKELLEMATPFYGRINSTSVHPCGLIISPVPISTVAPTQVRQEDNTTITQWTYPQLESLGFIKMDLLGLNSLDIIDLAVANVKKSTGKELNMRELIMGPMDDKKTYEMLQRGDTVGIFQLSGAGVRDLLKRAKPNKFMDIATITALYRPGPMSTNAHNEWADRNTGATEVVPIHKSFIGTPIEKILEPTSGILVFQEQLMQIVTQYANMTPYEADTLRKAMGKKNMNIMMSLKPKFTEGAMKNGATLELANLVWDTMEGFGQYGFNKSHSVSYAINAYQMTYLKANYPAEYMAAAIQNARSSKEATENLQETMSMGLKVGPVDINQSDVYISATNKQISDSKYDIVYGFMGIKQVNEEISSAIINERNSGGPFTSVQNFIQRVGKHVTVSKSTIANLAQAGAFDSFGVSRKLVGEKADLLVSNASKTATKGLSLFAVAGAIDQGASASIELTGEDYDYVEKIKLEADLLGYFVSGHPAGNLGPVAKSLNRTTIKELKSSQGFSRESRFIIGTIANIKSKVKRNGSRSIAITIDDTTDTHSLYLPKHIVAAITKHEELKKLESRPDRVIRDNIRKLLDDSEVIPREPLEKYEVYLFEVKHRTNEMNFRMNVVNVTKLETSPNGTLPYDIRYENAKQLEELSKLIKSAATKSKKSLYVRLHYGTEAKIVRIPIRLTRELIMKFEKVVGVKNILTEGV